MFQQSRQSAVETRDDESPYAMHPWTVDSSISSIQIQAAYQARLAPMPARRAVSPKHHHPVTIQTGSIHLLWGDRRLSGRGLCLGRVVEHPKPGVPQAGGRKSRCDRVEIVGCVRGAMRARVLVEHEEPSRWERAEPQVRPYLVSGLRGVHWCEARVSGVASSGTPSLACDWRAIKPRLVRQ